MAEEYDEPPEYLPPEYLEPPVTGAATRGGGLQLNEYNEPPEYLTPDELMNDPGVSSRYGAFGRGFAEGVVPGVAGMGGGILAGAGTGALLGAAGFNPFTVGAGALIGGVAGGVGAGYLGSTAQNWMLEQTGQRDDPTSMFSRRQQQADIAQFPYTRFAGEMGPSLMTLRPGGTWGQRVAGGVIGGGVGGVADYVETGQVDPYKVGMGVVAGAALPNINRPTSNLLAGAAPRSWQPHMPNYDPASRTSTRDEGYYLPRAPRPEGPIQPYGPQRPPPPEPPMPGTGEGLPGTSPQAPRGVPPSPAPNDPAMPGVGTNLPGTTPAPGAPPPRYAPPPEEVFGAPAGASRTSLPGTDEGRPGTSYAGSREAVDLQQRLDTVRAQMSDPHVDPVMREHWGAYARSLRERQIAMAAGLSDAQLQASQGAGPRNTPELVARANDITTVSSGVAHENQKVSVPSAGNPTGAPMLAREAARPNDPTRNLAKAAVRTAPGAPTVPTTTVVKGNVAPDLAVAAKAAQPAPAAPTPAAAPPAAPAVAPPTAPAARPAAPVAAPVTPPVARPAPAPRQAAPRAPRAAPPAAAEDARVAANNRRIAELEAAMAAQVQPPAAPAVTAPVAPAPARPVATTAQRQAHAAAVEQQVAQAKAMGSRTPAPKPAATETAIAASMRRAEAKAAAAPVIPREPPAVPVAKRPTLTLPTKKETVGQKLAKAAKKLATEEKGSLSIGALTRRSTEPVTKEQALRQLSRRFMPTPGMRPHEIADLVTAAAEGDARYALTLMNRKMTESRGWALKQDVIKARDILYKRAENIEMRAEPSPEVPVVPGKTRQDLKPKPPKEEVAEKPFAAPGKRTELITTDTGEVRKPITFREEPRPEKPHGLDNYTPDEKMRFMDAIEALPHDKQVEALTLTKAVPKDKVLANVGNLSSFLEQERAGRTMAGREQAETGKGSRNLQDKAHREGILAAYDKAVADNPRPTGRDETLSETLARAKKIVDATNDGINSLVAQLTRDRPKFAHTFTGALDITRLKNPPPATKVVRAARELLNKRSITQKHKFDTEEVLALAPEAKETGGGLTEGAPEAAGETLAGPRYEARVDPDSPTFTSDHKALTDMLNGMSNKAHDMMQDAWGEDIAAEVRSTKNPNQLRTDLLGALIDAQDKQNKYAHALETYPETLVKVTPVSDRAGIARVEQTGRFKSTKPADYQNLTEAERKAAPVRGVQDVTVETYRQIKAAIEEFFGRKALPGKLAKGEVGGVSPEKSEKWLAQAGRILGEIPHDYRGSFDVTKIFDWIDKVQKKFRPDREPMVPTGMTRLYRVEPDGKWAAPTRAEIANDKGTPPTKYADVPTSVLEQYRVDGDPGVTGKAAERFARKWEREMHTPPVADRRVPVDPEDAGFVDHLRKLWADESGALDISRMPAWIPNAGAKLRNMFARNAAPATQEYHDQLAAGKSASAMGEKIALGWNVKLRTDTVRVLRDTDKLLRNATYEDGKVPVQAAAKQMGDAYAKNDLAVLPARERKFFDDKVMPLIKKQADLYDEVRSLSTELQVPDYEKLVDPVNMGKGFANFLPRMFKRVIDVTEDYDPRFNRRNPLSMWKPSTRERDWQTVVRPNGERQLYHINEEGNMVRYHDGVAGDVIRGLPEEFNPRQVGSKLDDGSVIDHATDAELIAHGRDDKGRYTQDSFEHNPIMRLGNSINDLAYLRSRLLFMKNMHTDPEYAKHVTTDEKTAEARWGAGNVGQTILTPLKRNFYPKAVARAFDDTVKQGLDYNGNRFMEGVSRFAQSSLKPFYFIGPEVHVLNELDKLLIGRGFDNLNPAKTMRNFTAGLREVRSQGPMTDLYMEAGGNPMFLHAALSRFVPNMARRFGAELQEKHWKLDPLFKAAGINTKAKYWEPAYQGSNKMMWWQSDVLGQMLFHDNLDRHGGGYKNWNAKFAELDKLRKLEQPTAAQVTKRDELAAWQMDLARKSVKETEKIIDSYVVPTTFIKENDFGRTVQQLLTDPATANFGRFSHGLMKTLINIGKNMAGQNENLSAGHSAALGFSQAGMLLLMANIVYPLLSKAYAQMPWSKPESEVEKRGITSVATIPSEMYHKGIKDTWAKVARRAWSPSVPINLGLTAYENRDNVGRPIMESAGKGGWAAVPLQAAGHVFDQIVSPAGQVSRAYAQEGAGFATKRFLESNFGVKTPSEAQIKYERQRPQTEARQGKSRERHPHGVFDIIGNEARKLVRGYEEGGPVTATATGVIPTSGG